jgi:chromosomal replication initiator protein
MPNPKVTAAPQVRRSLTDIIYVVSEHYGISPSELLGRSRLKSVAQARAVAYALARDITPTSLPEIGDVFGRDHTTVMAVVQDLAKRATKDEPLARSIAVCRSRALATIAARRMV